MSATTPNTFGSQGLLPVQTPDGALSPRAASQILRANVIADFAFFRRSRLLMAFGVAFLVLTGLSILPSLFSDSRTENLGTLHEIFGELRIFLLILSGGLGLFLVSSHLRNRSLKMVFTKPCTPSNWIVSAMISSAAVSLILNLAVLAAMIVLSYCWHLPVRPALIFLSLENFVTSIVVIGYTVMLATIVHPALAVTFVAIFNAELFFNFQQWTMASIASGQKSVWMKVLNKIFHAIYMALPMYSPYDKHFEEIERAVRVDAAGWKYLLYSLAYSLVFSVFAYGVALLSMRRKRHI